jgi:hypothetical protein
MTRPARTVAQVAALIAEAAKLWEGASGPPPCEGCGRCVLCGPPCCDVAAAKAKTAHEEWLKSPEYAIALAAEKARRKEAALEKEKRRIAKRARREARKREKEASSSLLMQGCSACGRIAVAGPCYEPACPKCGTGVSS